MKLCSSRTSRKKDSAWSWLVCFSSSLSLALIFSFTQCFAIVMPVFLQIFKESKTKTAWAGSIGLGLTFFAMPFSTMFINRTNFRVGAVVGALMSCTSLVITSFTQNLLQIFFSYSILYGLGTSLVFTSAIVAVTNYFEKRQAVAVGLLNAGQNIGTLSLGPIIQTLLDLYGLRWMYRIIAASFVLPIVLTAIANDPNVEGHANHQGNESRPEETIHADEDATHHGNESGLDETTQGVTCVTNAEEHATHHGNGPDQTVQDVTCVNILKVFKAPAYVIAVVSLTIQSLTCYVSYVHLISYCIEVNIEAQRASRLFIAIGVSSMVSCVVCGRIMDIKTVNPFHVSQAGALSMGLSMLLLQLATEYYHFIIYSVFLGLGIGSFVTTIVVLLLKTVESSLSLVAFSIGQTIVSLGNILGPPLIGFIADVEGSYRPAFFTAGGIMLLAFVTPFLQYCFKSWRKQPIDHLVVEVTHDVTNDAVSNDVTKVKQRNDGEPEEIVLKNLNSDIPESYINVFCVTEELGESKIEESKQKLQEYSDNISDNGIPSAQLKTDERDQTSLSKYKTDLWCINAAFDSNDIGENATASTEIHQNSVTSEDILEDSLNTKL